MTTKERIQAELEHLSEEDMAELLRVIQSRGRAGEGRKPGLLSRLRQAQIDAPEDFAASLDQYESGEKRVGGQTDVH
jgi:hypothetical protein